MISSTLHCAMTDHFKFQVADLLEQAEGKLTKAGLDNLQSMLLSKTPDWVDELRTQLTAVSL